MRKELNNKMLFLIILLIGVVLRGIIATRNPIFLQDFILNDDSFYCFNIARNIALGNGIRHDSFDITNGFQPLFVFLIVPIFKVIQDKLLAINVVLLFQTLISMIYAMMLYKITRMIASKGVATLILAIWAFSPFFITTDLNGLETSTAFCMLCFIIYYYLKNFKYSLQSTNANHVILGVLLGIAVMARFDLIFLMFAIGLGLLWKLLKSNEKAALGKKALLIICSMIFTMSPWLIYNLIVGRSLVPVSGEAVRFNSLSDINGFLSFRGIQTNLDIKDASVPFIYYWETVRFGLERIPIFLNRVFPLKVGAVIFVFWAIVRFKGFKEFKKLAFFYVFLLLIFFSYTCYVFGQWFFHRYFSAFAIGYLFVLAIAMKNIIEAELFNKYIIYFKQIRFIFIFIILCELIYGSVNIVKFCYLRKDSSDFYKMAQWANQHTEKDAIIGAFQSGIFGYFVERKFYGLDGKINKDALVAMKEFRIDQYIIEKHINYLIDWPYMFFHLLVDHSHDHDFLKKQVYIYDSKEASKNSNDKENVNDDKRFIVVKTNPAK